MATTYQQTVDEPRMTLFKWSAVFAGLTLGLGLLMLLTALWLALGLGSNVSTIGNNLDWFIGVSAVVSLFVAGILTGYMCGVGGAGTGFIHGLALWALLMLVTVIIGIPSILNLFGMHDLANRVLTGNLSVGSTGAPFWTSFWTILGGFVAAGIGGLLGGLGGRKRSSSMVTSTQPGPVRLQAPPRERVAE
jgi:hypothetical protein